MRYSIILPVFNEEESLSVLYKRIVTIMRKLNHPFELIFINDGSYDRTSQTLTNLHTKDERVKIINFSRNFGHQMAVSAGLRYSTGEQIAILDSDLQDPPEILPAFFEKLDEGYDAVYAVRKRRKENLLKRAAYRTFYRFLLFRTAYTASYPSSSFSKNAGRI